VETAGQYPLPVKKAGSSQIVCATVSPLVPPAACVLTVKAPMAICRDTIQGNCVTGPQLLTVSPANVCPRICAATSTDNGPKCGLHSSTI